MQYISLISLIILSFSDVLSQDLNENKKFTTPDVNVISITPIQGSGVTLDRMPSNIQTVNEADLKENKYLSVVESLNKKTAGISISNLNSSPMQNDINYRGYVAGPLLGTAQALAIYQNGMRLNESFGEIVQWDLIPEFAIQNMQSTY